MEYAKDKIFNMRYNKYENVSKKNARKESLIARHKIITVASIITIIAIGINVSLIVNFFTVLSTL